MKKIKFVRHTLIALMGLTPFAIIPAITTSCTPTEIGNFDLSKILDSEIPTEHIQIFAVDPTHVTINEEQAIEVDHTLRSDIQALIAKHLPNVTPKDYTINSLPVPSEDMTKEVPIEMSIIATRTGALSGAKYFTVYVKADNTARFNIGACQGDIPQQTVYVTYKKDPSKVPSSVIKNVIDHHNGIKNLIIDSISKISGKKTITDKDFTFSVQVPDIGDYTKHPVYPIEVTAIDKNPSGLTGNFTIDCIIAIYAEDAKDLSSYEINPTDFIMHSLTPHTVTGADFDSFINYYKTLAYESISEKSGISIEDLKKDNLQFSDGHIDGGNYSSPLKVIINVKAWAFSEYFVNGFSFIVNLSCDYTTVSINNIQLKYPNDIIINNPSPNDPLSDAQADTINHNSALLDAITNVIKPISPDIYHADFDVKNNAAGKTANTGIDVTITVEAKKDQTKISGSFSFNAKVKSLDERKNIENANIGTNNPVTIYTFNPAILTQTDVESKLFTDKTLHDKILNEMQKIDSRITVNDYTLSTDTHFPASYSAPISTNITITAKPDSKYIVGTVTTANAVTLTIEQNTGNKKVTMSCVATPENTVPWPVSNNEWACHGLRLEHGLEITSFNFTISLNTDTLNKIEWDATQISHDNIHTLALNGKITGVFNLGGTSYHRLHGPMISNKNVNISGGDWDIAKNEGPTNTITYAAAHHKETYDIKNFTPSFFLKYIDSNHFEIVQKNGVNPEWRMDIHDNVKTKINNIKTIDNYLYAFTPL